MIIKYVFLVLFFAVMLAVGFYCRRSATDVNGFVLGGRKVGPWLTAFSYGTSYFSAVIFVGYAGQFGWKFGMASTWIGLGNAAIGSLMAWVLLGRRTRVMTQHLHSSTMPEYFGERFNSKALKIAAAVIVFVFLIPYTASLYNGLSRLFEMAFSFDYTLCVVVMAALTGVYVIAGGYMATAVNDLIQGIIMIGGIIAVVAAVLNNHGGLMGAITELSKVPCETSSQLGAFSSFLGPEPFNLFCVIVLTSLGTWGLPQMVQKFYAIKDERSIKSGTIISTAFAIIVAGGCYFLGGFGRLYKPEMIKGNVVFDSIIPNMISGLPDILIGIVIILVLSASMSTLSSLVLTSGSTLTLDFINPLRKKPMADRSKLLCIRILIVFFILVSAIIAIVQVKSNVTFIAQLMGISWGALAGAFLAPYLYSLYWKKVTAISVWVSFAFGTGFMILNMFFKHIFPAFLQSPINAGVFAMLLSLVVVPIVSLITKKLPQSYVEDVFSCYNQKIVVSAKDSLDE